jgi:hypothetical protein
VQGDAESGIIPEWLLPAEVETDEASPCEETTAGNQSGQPWP